MHSNVGVPKHVGVAQHCSPAWRQGPESSAEDGNIEITSDLLVFRRAYKTRFNKDINIYKYNNNYKCTNDCLLIAIDGDDFGTPIQHTAVTQTKVANCSCQSQPSQSDGQSQVRFDRTHIVYGSKLHGAGEEEPVNGRSGSRIRQGGTVYTRKDNDICFS